MARLNVDETIAKWGQRTQAAVPDYQKGVQNTQKDWAGLTSAAVPAMAQNFAAAANDGRIEAGIQAVGTGGWKSRTLAKANNFGTGVALAVQSQKTRQGFQRLFNFLGAGDAAIASMPRSTNAQREARGAAYRNAVHQAALASGHGRL